jgi:hypothetical protein
MISGCKDVGQPWQGHTSTGEKGVEDEQRGQNKAADIVGASMKEPLGLALLSETKCGGLGALTVKSLKNQEILEV